MRGRLCLFSAVVLALAVMPAASAEEGALEEDIEASVVLGLEWLAGQQNADGSFGSYEFIGHTGLAVLKFEDRALDLGFDPIDPAYEYAAVVEAGLVYLATHALTQAIVLEPAGNPDSDGDGIGVYWQSEGSWHQIYSTGVAMMALSASQHPELYEALVQDAIDYLAWAQADPECGAHRGGWRYGPDTCDTDNSTSGYATLGLGYATAPPPVGFGLTMPQFVKDELSIWIDVMQDDVNGDPNDGGSWYDIWTPWVNILKTGNLLFEMALVGDTTAQRVQDAVDYVERTWTSLDPDVGWMNHRQAVFAMMKGLTAQGREFLDLDGDGTPETEWFPIVAQHLIDTQNPDGSWPYDYWGDQILSTAWALLTLEKAVPVPTVPVGVDIKPMSCPNAFNVGLKGLLPVAVVGTEDLDVATIDPATVMLEGVAPLRWAYEDVASPFEPFLEKEGALDCTTAGADGYGDLVFHFDALVVSAALGPTVNREVRVLSLTGSLLEEFGGTPIVGEDVIVILKRG